MSNTENKVAEILKSSGLDFRIEKLPMAVQVGDKKIITDYYGLLNDKTGEVINSVKGSYTVSQNEDIVSAVVKGMQPFGDLNVSKAGSINGGRKVYMQLAVDGLSRVGDDDVKRYVTVIDSNDGSAGLSVGIGDFTMSCENQFYQFLKSGQHKSRHTKTIEQKIAELPSLISMALEQSMRMIELYNKFASTPASKELAHKMVNHLLGYDRTMKPADMVDAKGNPVSTRVTNAMDMLYKNISTEMEQKGDNLWGLHSGVTRWTTHDKSAPTRDNGRVESSMLGTNYKTNQASLEFTEMIMG